MRPRNVVLIGFMGAGKTVVGRALATHLDFRLFDTDAMVVEEAGMEIPEIWATEGEPGFRAREEKVVLRACAGSGHVIACGGGAILSMKNYGVLKGAGPIVYLRAPADVLRARVDIGGEGRPLLPDDAAFGRLLVERVPIYESAADLTIDADAGTPEQLASLIEQRVSDLPERPDRTIRL
ncbi:MAG TPA: shikimate kinase [Actinomycetota bacterium]